MRGRKIVDKMLTAARGFIGEFPSAFGHFLEAGRRGSKLSPTAGVNIVNINHEPAPTRNTNHSFLGGGLVSQAVKKER